MIIPPEEVHHLICLLKNVYGLNQILPQPYHTIFSTLYNAIWFFAFVCNSLLLICLYRHNKGRLIVRRRLGGRTKCARQYHRSIRSKMSEKTRDHLIGHLSSLDLLLSLTLPFTTLDVLTMYWPLGPNTEFIARLTRAVPPALINSSSVVITLIAINCYRQILHSSEQQLTPRSIRYLLIPIILVSIIMSIPTFYFTNLDDTLVNRFKMGGIDINQNYMSLDSEMNTVTSNTLYNGAKVAKTRMILTNTSENEDTSCQEHNDLNLSYVSFITDDWTTADQWLHNSRFWYSIFSIVTQLIIPFFIISFCYYFVSRRLKKQTEIQRRVIITSMRMRKENERNKRRNRLLVTISLVYLLTWLPLSVFGILSDSNVGIFGDNPNTIIIVFVICHLIGMSSTFANPIIYGFRNKHVRQGTVKMP